MAVQSLRIGELASQTGVATSALRFYEEAGLVGPARRTDAGYRLYGPEAAGRVRFIQRAKSLGLSLDEIRTLIHSGRTDGQSERDALRHLLAHKLAQTRARVAELRGLETDLSAMYVRLLRLPAGNCGHVGDCGCWLPTEKEVMKMSDEIVCCSEGCECKGCEAAAGCSCCGETG